MFVEAITLETFEIEEKEIYLTRINDNHRVDTDRAAAGLAENPKVNNAGLP